MTPYFKWLAIGLWVFVSMVSCHMAFAATVTLQSQTIHLYDVTFGFLSEDGTGACAPAGTEVYVVADTGLNSLTVSINRVGVAKVGCAVPVSPGNLYTIPKSALLGGKYSSRGFVSGLLSVPFKWHLADRSITVGSTVGAYVGYRSVIFNEITITPIVGGGLALISDAAPGATVSSTTTGVSLATGFIGSVGPTGSGVQWGIILGSDWLGRSVGYRYEGKPWVALEVGYNFGL